MQWAREVNGHIREVSQRFRPRGTDVFGFFCECGCHQLSPINLRLEEFDRLRAHGQHVRAPGHAPAAERHEAQAA
jgi:hypothetical protein